MSSKYPPRYKPSGLEMIPTPRYAVRCLEGAKPGFVWLYEVPDGFVIMKSDGEKILTATSKNLRDLDADFYSNQLQDFLLDRATEGLSVPDALARVREHYGDPAYELACSDINDVEPEVRALVTSLV
ncbi:MAG: hypothetical protein Q3976_07855 [Corynebacterium sp.]|nr:hypothetical protein [Corynebacterium sp.]